MKNLILGLAVVAIAFSASAFKNVSYDYFLVNDPEHGYVVVSTYDFDVSSCIFTNYSICVFRILTTDYIPSGLLWYEIRPLIRDGKIIALNNPLTGEPYLGDYIF